jgi:hypothetical protein
MFPSCEMAPLAAKTVIDEVAGVAEAETLKVTAWLAPAAREKDEEGEGATPGGIPCNWRAAEPVKPFFAITVTVAGVVIPPSPMETDDGETEMLKSGAGERGGAIPPPQQVRAKANASSENSRRPL